MDRLTLAGYLEAGGVTGALARSAEEAYATLDHDAQESARRLLVRLADTDEGGALVRRPVPLAELDLEGERGTARRTVVDGFVARRLLSLDGERLDVTHEALLTGWPRLARWLEDDAAGRAVRRHLTPAAQEWQRRGRPDDELYRGTRLGAALDWAGAADDELTAGEREFLEASKARADAELLSAQQRVLTEARGRRRLRWLAAGLAGVLVVALGTAVLAVRSEQAADRATAVAEETSLVADANRLAALSGTAESLDLTYLLAAQGFRLSDTPETRDALLASLVDHRRVIHTETINEGAPRFPRRRRPDGLRRQPPHRPDFRLARRLGEDRRAWSSSRTRAGRAGGPPPRRPPRPCCSPPAPVGPGHGSARSTPTVRSPSC